jgi:tetratricopeptide (TPR) repeat protein
LIIIIISFIIYGNSLTNDYAVDDIVVFTENSFTQKGISGIPEIFKYDTFTGHELAKNPDKTLEQLQEEIKFVAGGRYRPLSVATFAVEVSLFSKKIKNIEFDKTYLGNPFVSHFINLILYILTTCLLIKILSTFFPVKENKKWFLSLPFVATLLFLAHPIHTEAIANIKGRDEIMTLLGSLGALWFSMVYCRNKKTYNLFLSGICLFLGLLSKENAITFLAVIPISLYFFSEKKPKTVLITLIPLITASVIFLLIRGYVLGFSNLQNVSHNILNDPFLYASFSQKYATIFYTLWLYIKLLIFPHPLTHDYYPLQIEIINFANPKAFIPLLIYLLLTIYAVYTLIRKDKNPIVSWSIWIFLLPLSVVSNLFFSVGTFMNERFIFISSIGFCVILAWLFIELLPKFIKNVKILQTVVYFSLIIILSFYSVKTINRNRAWKNDYVLCTTDVKTSFNSTRCNRLAGEYMVQKAKLLKNKSKQDKLYEQAIIYLKNAVKLYPEGKYPEALYLLGEAYYGYNYDISNTLKQFAKCLNFDNYLYEVAYKNTQIVANHTLSLLSENKTNSSPKEILNACDEILIVIPDFGEIIHLKAMIYGKYLNDVKTGISLFEEANTIEKFEKSLIFYSDMGVVYGLANNYEKALFYMLKSIELGNTNYRTYMNVASVYHHLGDSRNANKYFALAQEMEKD